MIGDPVGMYLAIYWQPGTADEGAGWWVDQVAVYADGTEQMRGAGFDTKADAVAELNRLQRHFGPTVPVRMPPIEWLLNAPEQPTEGDAHAPVR